MGSDSPHFTHRIQVSIAVVSTQAHIDVAPLIDPGLEPIYGHAHLHRIHRVFSAARSPKTPAQKLGYAGLLNRLT